MPTENKLTYYKGTIFINYQNMGWSESIDINAASDSAATLVLQAFVNHRKWVLPVACTIVYARVTKVPFQRYTIALSNMPVAGAAPTLTTANTIKPNDAMVAPCFHFIADEGKASIRFIRGVPDDQVLDMLIVPSAPAGSWIDVSADPGDGTANPGTWAVALKKLNSFIGFSTVLASKRQILTIASSQQEGYRLRVFTGILSREARKKSTGRPFGMPRGRAPAHS